VEWDDQFDRIRRAHLLQISPLLQKRDELKRKEDEARRKLDAQFPGSMSEWRSTRNKGIQVRIARFLMADKREQETMMAQYGWAHRQVNTLRNEYKIDVRAFFWTPMIASADLLLCNRTCSGLRSRAKSWRSSLAPGNDRIQKKQTEFFVLNSTFFFSFFFVMQRSASYTRPNVVSVSVAIYISRTIESAAPTPKPSSVHPVVVSATSRLQSETSYSPSASSRTPSIGGASA
jgi:hypothetical protein